jgi:hypothetical protein
LAQAGPATDPQAEAILRRTVKRHPAGDGQTSRTLIELAPPGGGLVFHPVQVGSIIRQLDELLEHGDGVEQPLTLSGQFPIWLVAAAVAHLVRRCPACALATYDIRLAAAVVVRGDSAGRFLPGMTILDKERASPVPTIALVGDPNSGKSVLSWKLYWALQRLNRRVFRIDCDAAAPTAAWSMHSDEGRRLRAQHKQWHGGWQPEDPQALQDAQDAVEGARRANLDLLLLDMPGGLHADVDEPIRIPADRAALFRLADWFILVAKDERARVGWSEALAEIGLGERIGAVVVPSKDTTVSEEYASGQEPPRFVIHQLDRGRLDAATLGVGALAKWVTDCSQGPVE